MPDDKTPPNSPTGGSGAQPGGPTGPTAPQTPPAVPPPSGPGDERKLGELVFDVTEGVSGLVREEIQLAKAEVSEKAGKIAKERPSGSPPGSSPSSP